MDHIELANCHVTILKDKGGATEWLVKDQQGNEIAKLPNTLDEHQVMAAVHFARKFELKAWNAGIAFGKKLPASDMLAAEERGKLHRVIEELTEANNILADKMNKFGTIKMNGNGTN